MGVYAQQRAAEMQHPRYKKGLVRLNLFAQDDRHKCYTLYSKNALFDTLDIAVIKY